MTIQTCLECNGRIQSEGCAMVACPHCSLIQRVAINGESRGRREWKARDDLTDNDRAWARFEGGVGH